MTHRPMVHSGLDPGQSNQFRLKFTNLLKTENHSERTLTLIVGTTCYSVLFPKGQSGMESDDIVNFTENFGRAPYKCINDHSVKGLRNKLSSLMTHLESLANFEKVTSKTIANYLLMLYSKKSTISKVRKCARKFFLRERFFFYITANIM